MGKLGKILTESKLGRWLANDRVQNVIIAVTVTLALTQCLLSWYLASYCSCR